MSQIKPHFTGHELQQNCETVLIKGSVERIPSIIDVFQGIHKHNKQKSNSFVNHLNNCFNH